MGEGHGVRREEERREEKREEKKGEGVGGDGGWAIWPDWAWEMGWGPPCRAEPIIRGWPYFWGYVAC